MVQGDEAAEAGATGPADPLCGEDPAARTPLPAGPTYALGMDPASKLHPLRRLLRGLGLFAAACMGSLTLGLSAFAALLGTWHFVALGGSALLLCVALGLASWWPRRRRQALVAALLGLVPALSLLLPLPQEQEGAALIRSRSVFGERGTPWFAGLPEAELVRAGEGLGWRGHEARSVERLGGVASVYPALAPGLFERQESLVLDSWVLDRGHYFFALPPTASRSRKAPLLVFLHGNGGNFRVYASWLAPLASKAGIATAFPTWGFGNWRSPAALQRVLEVIDDAGRSGEVDPERVLLVGLSAGALGAVEMLLAKSERFRGLALISGAPLEPLSPEQARAAARVPAFLVHGDLDGHLPVEGPRRFAAALRAAGGSVHYDEVSGADHTLLLFEHERILEELLAWARPLLGLK